jgi:hypothetical protein
MFQTEATLPDALAARVTELRVSDADFAWKASRLRLRRRTVAPRGRLNLLAADHPARHLTRVGTDAMAMADRRGYLARILRVLESSRVDGVMATMDILEDLLTIDALRQEAGAAPLLNERLLIASLNRGGLAGSAWELDDPMTGATPATCCEWNLDGAKILLRVDLSDPASLKTLTASAMAIREAVARGLPVFLEPLPVVEKKVTRSAEALARLAGVASALGTSSRYLWLKLPYAEGFEAVARATTLPILILGGEAAGDPAPFLTDLARAMQAGANVRGALVGRNVLYPGAMDPLVMADAVGGIVHEGWSATEALERC